MGTKVRKDMKSKARAGEVMDTNSKIEKVGDAKSRVRRLPLVCIPCARRKIGCDKQIPCSNCVKRNRVNECKRALERLDVKRDPSPEISNEYADILIPHNLDINNIVKETPTVPHHSDIGQTFTRLLDQNTKLNEFNNESSLEDYIRSVQSLTFGLTKFEGLLPSYYSADDIPEFHEAKLENLLSLLNYNVSYRICLLSCQHTILLHQGLVLSLFMQDHEKFWNIRMIEDPTSLYHLKPSNFKSLSARDYFYWISLYYMVLCTGLYYARDELKPFLPYDDESLREAPKVFFLAALDCIYKARALEVPDIRFLQVYGIMAICSHAFGNAHLNSQLLRIAIGTAQSLELHTIEDNILEPLSFEKEVAKRLWYNLYIIDALSNKESLIKQSITPVPRLVTLNALMNGGNLQGETLPDDEYFGLLYQRILIKMGQIKQESRRPNLKFSQIATAWVEMNQLRDNIEKYFDLEVITGPNLRYGTGNYARYLIFSSLTRESLDLGCRLLSYVGRNVWFDNFRDKCIALSLNLLVHNASFDLPPYYKKHWIVVQHLIYACMFVLLNMLMFKERDDQRENSIQLELDNLRNVELAIKTISDFKDSHFTAKVGLAVIDKLHYLVSSLSLRNSKERSVEDISLKGFLHDLKISGHSRHGIKKGIGIIPPLNESQYLRYGQVHANTSSPENGLLGQRALDRNTAKEFLDPELDKVLDDTGWYEFVDFFFGNKVD